MKRIKRILETCSVKDNILVPEFRITKTNKRIGAVFQWWNRIIIFNEIYVHTQSLIPMIYHEYEHWYQFTVDRDEYLFWNPVPEETDEFYLECSHRGICPIELDAQTFGQSLGEKNLRFLYRDISVQELEQYKLTDDYSGLEARLLEIIHR
jgi:hypothetical protein